MEMQNRSTGSKDRGGDRRARKVRLSDKELAAAGFPPDTAKSKCVKNNIGLDTWRRPLVAAKSKPGSIEKPPVLIVRNNGDGFHNSKQPVVGVRRKPESTVRPPVLGVRNNDSGLHSSKRPALGVGSKPDGTVRPPILNDGGHNLKRPVVEVERKSECAVRPPVVSGSGHNLKWPVMEVERNPEGTVRQPVSAVRNNGESHKWKQTVLGVRSKPGGSEKPPGLAARSNGGARFRSWRRPVVAVKSKPGIETGSSSKRENLNGVERRENVEPREKIRGLLELFRATCSKLRRNSAASLEVKERRVDLKAWKELINEGLIPNRPERILGTVPGTETGDKFSYRIELLIAGLHSRIQNGIDYTDIRGYKLATCVVAVEGYSDKMNDSNILWYTGEGGFNSQSQCPKDQRLKGGNLALYHSHRSKGEVRVVRGLKNVDYGNPKIDKITYIYDGLYDVTDCKKERGPMGNMVYRFQLTRRPNQKSVNWKGFHR